MRGRAVSSRAVACVALAGIGVLGACSSTHRNWGRSGSISLYISENVEVRCAKPVVDAQRKSIRIAWVGARTPEDRPKIDSLSLVLFADRNGNRQPDAGEIQGSAESVEPTRSVMFGALREVSGDALEHLFGRVRVKCGREDREVLWPLARKKSVP